ncbi:ABC transporter permease [Haloarchaeobius sp. HME9146]|uniref:ABC transporter permease n=1 Tax=Haloarchaeobius sp. HME9146 TaxID=2978732 RepID=UPI0021BEE2FE|nr:ABC transporter permease [Haloarchaeobius sp. HME9146]MCT9095582.1 ABC transporter permease [Haloarchaeobius sp. HME9146]
MLSPALIGKLPEAYRFLMERQDEFITLLTQHVKLVLFSELLAICVAIPLGIAATRNPRAKTLIQGVGNTAQTIPTLAIIALVFPLVGIGFWPSVIGLFTYALLPILTNTIAGIEEVDDSIVEAARGMGMTDWEILRKIQLPKAVPVIFAGIRTSSVINVGTAYLAFFIAGGGLGVWVVGGIRLYNMNQALAGAIPGALLAITLDSMFALIERKLGGEAAQSQNLATG